MGLNFKSPLGGKSNAGPTDASQVIKNTQTSDSIISQAVSQAGNISQSTLSKQEHERILAQRNKIPVQVTLLKYFSLTLLAAAIIAGLLLKADLSPTNSYLKILGLADNTGSKFIALSQEKNELTSANSKLKAEVDSLTTRSDEFDAAEEDRKITLLVPELLEIEKTQKRWFNETVEVVDENGQLREETAFGLIDSFDAMIEYFEDQAYQPRFFTEKNRNESLSGSEPEVCNVPDSRLSEKQKVEKRQAESAGKCTTKSTLIMANNVDIRGISINQMGVNVTVTASDLLSRVFTLTSEFVAMMNSYPFYKNGEIVNFNRREVSDGGDSSEIALRLEFQETVEEDLYDEEGELIETITRPEDDPYDQYLVDLLNWRENQR